MKKQIATVALVFVAALGAQAQQVSTVIPRDKTQSTPRLNAQEIKADRLSAQMARDLRLNGYQSGRVQAINAAQAKKMATIAQQNAGNQKAIDQQCDEVCRQRDAALRGVLSNDQYTDYYGQRAAYNKVAKDFAMQNADAQFVKSVRDPAPVSSNGATIGPAKSTTDPRPAATRARGASKADGSR
ncbi:hypothetical protein [Hymenobacter profundi]|uniref:DUF4168 domain-containing protein n=1 Tax=Hymenobacter profundi TaxID=1982110 RepID=A0ABS6X099_9BACT|nr:hypothetical protein [Hymenobacter profundi]MBW3128384.1 hypothetical protein [Hymenobacter profundi]